jgi:hypothetical protein
MSVRLCLRSAARWRQPVPCRYAAPVALVAIALLAQGCAADPPRVFRNAEPSDPHIHVPPVVYRSTFGADAGGRPVEPAPWTGHNNGGAPAPTKDGQ